MNAPFDYHVLLDELAGPAGLKLVLALLHFVWQGVLIAAGAAVLMQLVGRRSPQRRYAVGVAAMVLMAVAPVVTFCLVTPPVTPVVEPLPLADASELFVVDLEQFDALLTTLDVPADDAPVIAPQAPRLTWGERLRLIQPYAVLLWLVGSLLCGLRLVIGAHASLRCRRGRRGVPDPWIEAVAKAAGRIGLKAPRVFVSDRVAEAVALGLLRPMVLLPAAWIGRIPPDVLEAVLAHELAHIRRYDLWVNLFQRVVESLLFYHPAVWWLSRRVRLEREYCCDDAAAAAVASRAAYAKALEYVATERVAAGRPELFQAALAAGMRGGDSMALLNRVRRVLWSDQRPPRRPRLSEGLLALAVPAALWAAVVTIGPAFAQEEPVEAPKTEPTLEDAVEEAYQDFDVQPGKSLDDVVEGLAQNDGSPIQEPSIDWIPKDRDDELHSVLQELREELKSLQHEVKELQAGKKESRTESPEIDGFVIERLRELNAAAAARDEVLERSLGFEYAKDRDPESERLLREQLREAQQRLEEIYESLKQAGFEPPNLPPGVGAGAGDHHYEFRIERDPDGKTRIKAVQPGTFLPENDSAPTTQILFTGPAGATISGRVPHTGDDWKLTAPTRHFFPHNASYEFKFSHIPGRKELTLNARLQLPPGGPIAEKFLALNAVPIELTGEDLDQVAGNNHVTKVVYLPKTKFRDIPAGKVETLVSTRLDPGVDPFAEGLRRGQVLAVLNIVRHPLPLPDRKLLYGPDDPVSDDAWDRIPLDADLSANTDDSLPSEVTGKDGRRYRAVMEAIETKSGKTIHFKRYVPVDKQNDNQPVAPPVLLSDDFQMHPPRAAKAKPHVRYEPQPGPGGKTIYVPRMRSDAESPFWQPPDKAGNIVHIDLGDGKPVPFVLEETRETPGEPARIHLRLLKKPEPGTNAIPQPENDEKPDDAAPKEASADVKKLVEEYRHAVKSRDEAARLAASEAAEGVAHSQKRLVEAQRELERLQADLARRKIIVGLPAIGTASADDGPSDDDSLRVVAYAVGDLIASGSHVKKPVTGMLDTLVNLITRSVRPSSWEQAGGRGGIEKDDKALRLLIVQTKDAHEEIEALLKNLQALQGKRSDDGDNEPADADRHRSRMIETQDAAGVARQYHSKRNVQRVETALEKPVTLYFRKTPLEHVLAALRNIAGVSFVVDRQGLLEEGITPETPVWIDLTDVPISDALVKILIPMNLAFSTDDGVVKITSRQRAKGLLHVETYSVADLVLPVPHGNVVMNEEGEPAIALSAEKKQQVADRFDALIDLVTGTVEPASWASVGGPGVIRQNESTLSLVVRQTRDVHKEIAKLLRRLGSFEHGDPPPDKINRKHFTPSKANSSDEKPDGEAKQDDQPASEFDRLVSEYNELINQRDYAGALVIAAKARDSDPEKRNVGASMVLKAQAMLEDRVAQTEALKRQIHALTEQTQALQDERKARTNTLQQQIEELQRQLQQISGEKLEQQQPREDQPGDDTDETSSVPDVEGQDYKQARETLHKNGFRNIRFVKGTLTNDSQRRFHVESQQPVPNSTAESMKPVVLKLFYSESDEPPGVSKERPADTQDPFGKNELEHERRVLELQRRVEELQRQLEKQKPDMIPTY